MPVEVGAAELPDHIDKKLLLMMGIWVNLGDIGIYWIAGIFLCKKISDVWL